MDLIMTDKNIANFLLKMPRINRVFVEPFSKREKVVGFVRAASYAGLVFGALLLVSSFMFKIDLVFVAAVSALIFASVIMIFRVDGYRNETLRVLQLCSGYTAQTLPKEANIVRAALHIPFRTQRIPLRSFETDINHERSRGRGSFLVSHHHAKETGTHFVENFLVLKPGKVWFEQSATVTSFGIMFRDFQNDGKAFKDRL